MEYTKKLSDANVVRLMKLASEFKYDFHDELWWRVDDDVLTIFVNCNDLFYWACADVEKVTDDNIDSLEEVCRDIHKAYKANNSSDYPCPNHIASLFACRIRKMRPQGACYKNIRPEVVPLFDDCGPDREVEDKAFGNTKRREYEEEK